MLQQQLESSVTERFSDQQIDVAIAKHKIVDTFHFTAREIAIKQLAYKGKVRVIGRGESRRNHRSFWQGDCHWAAK